MENNFGESTRQQKVARQIQKDISELFLKECAELVKGVIVSVTAVRVSPDLEYARIYLSIFPFARHEEIMEKIQAENWKIRKLLGQRMRNQLRVVPEITFFLDDSLEYIENIDNLLKK
jgi:ribosome-binding factor A